MSITLQTVASGYNLSAINANFQSLQTALNNNILWRNGSVAGETLMTRDLDMNGNAILNIGVDLDNPDSLLTLEIADARYYNVAGDVLEGNLDAGQHQLKNLQAPTAQYDAVRKLELDGETTARQLADANLQEQMTGNTPLEASAFSEISWHGQEIANSVTIPDNKNAWSFGPQMEINVGQLVTIGEGSSWTVADGRVVENEDLHSLIADTLTTSDGASSVSVANLSAVAGTGVVPVNKGGTGATTASSARVNLSAAASGANTDITSITGSAATLTTSRTIQTNLASTTAASFNGSANITPGVTGILPLANGGTGAATASAARITLGAAASAGVTDASNAASGVVGEFLTAQSTAASITTSTATNLTSVTLTAGDWDVSGVATYIGATGAIVTTQRTGVSVTSATFGGLDADQISNATMATASTNRQSTPTVRINVSASTTVYLVGYATFSGGTVTAQAYIRARRIR